ncbi:hypothetical protein RYX36_013427 [Vicia faba]
MSSSNDLRSQAENIFNLCKQTYPDSLILKLAQLLHTSPNPKTRTMSTILLRRHLTRHHDDSFIYPHLTASTQSTLRSLLLSSLHQEPVKSIAKKLCNTVSELASALLSEDLASWPNLLPLLFQLFTSPDARLQEISLLVFAQLAHYIGETLIPQLSTLHSVFLRSLSAATSSSDVRIAALDASINFVQCLSNPSDRDKFQDLLPLMMQTLTEALNSGQEAIAQDALELLIELAGTEPRFLRRQIVDVVGAMLQISEAESLEEGTRHLAIEFVVTLAEARDRAPGMMRKLPQFVKKLFGVLMNLLLDIEDDATWHAAVSEDEDAGETSNYGFGQECLDRLSISLGGNTIVPVASELLPTYLSAPEWQKRHAALVAFAQIAEGCSKAHAASAVLNFTENCNPDILIPYLDGIVSKLLVLLQGGNQMVQEGALTALASVADSSQEKFQKYYDAVTPYLKAILLNANDKSNRMLRAKAMECISLVGMAFGKEKFRDDAKQVMDVLMSLQQSQLDVDDPTASYMLQAWARLCKCLGQDFLPYMGFVMPPLLQSAQLKPDVTITSTDSDAEFDEEDDMCPSGSGYCILGHKRFISMMCFWIHFNLHFTSLCIPFFCFSFYFLLLPLF